MTILGSALLCSEKLCLWSAWITIVSVIYYWCIHVLLSVPHHLYSVKRISMEVGTKHGMHVTTRCQRLWLFLICLTLPYVSICLHLFIDIYCKYVLDYDAFACICCSWTLLTSVWFFLCSFRSFNDNIRTALLCYKKNAQFWKEFEVNWWCLQLSKVKRFF